MHVYLRDIYASLENIYASTNENIYASSENMLFA